MDDLKLEHFAAAHGGQLLPVRKATRREVATLRAALLVRLKLPEATDGLSLVNAFASRSGQLAQVSAESAGFDLARVLADRVGVGPTDEVFLNWHRFDELDCIRAADLASFWTDIWYPAVDDLDVVGVGADWVLSIAHHGAVRLLRFDEP